MFLILLHSVWPSCGLRWPSCVIKYLEQKGVVANGVLISPVPRRMENDLSKHFLQPLSSPKHICHALVKEKSSLEERYF